MPFEARNTTTEKRYRIADGNLPNIICQLWQAGKTEETTAQAMEALHNLRDGDTIQSPCGRYSLRKIED